ncbi:hypothetical protein AAFA46_00510 [Oscillospiraceae bacterium WX1]
MKSAFKTIFASLLLLIVITVNASAASMASYTIDELGLTVQVPSDLVVFTRNLQPGDPYPPKYDLNNEGIKDFFIKNDIYFNAFSENITYEVDILSQETPAVLNVYDFHLLSSAELQNLMNNSKELYQNPDITYKTPELILSNPQAAFIKTYYQLPEDNKTTYGVMYYTIYNGHSVKITLRSYGVPISPEREVIVSDLVNSLSFSHTYTSSELEKQRLLHVSGFDLIHMLLIDAAATFLLFTVPILIYRFFIKRKPLEKEQAKNVAIIYGLAAEILVLVYIFISGNNYAAAGVIPWSFLNYFILICGRQKDRAPRPAPKPFKKPVAKPVEGKKGRPRFGLGVSKACPHCFAKNLADSEVCFYCGKNMNDLPND